MRFAALAPHPTRATNRPEGSRKRITIPFAPIRVIRSSNRCGSLRSLPILHGRGGRDRAFPPCPPRLRWFDLPSPPSP